jgi:hypothetical protein
MTRARLRQRTEAEVHRLRTLAKKKVSADNIAKSLGRYLGSVKIKAREHAELETLGASSVRFKLRQGGPGRGASISGFKCGDITRGDIEDWLIEKNIEETAIQQGTLRWAKIAGWAGIISVVVTVTMGALAIYLAK